jgi:general stress protein YciG
MKKGTDKMIREYLASIGRKGGKARASKYDKATLSKWAKKGGRPPKSKEGDKP